MSANMSRFASRKMSTSQAKNVCPVVTYSFSSKATDMYPGTMES